MADKTTITLVNPIERKGETINTVTLHAPSAGALRGLSGMDLMRMDFASVQKLLPRISEPSLLPEEVAGLSAPDLMQFAANITGFFMTPDEKAMTGLADENG